MKWWDKCHDLSFWMLSFKPIFSLSSFTFTKRLFSSSSLSAIRVVSSAYLRLLIFLLAILIPACASSSPAFHMMYSAYKLNKQGDNIQPWCTPFWIWNQISLQENQRYQGNISGKDGHNKWQKWYGLNRAEGIKKRWQEVLYRKDLNDPDNHRTSPDGQHWNQIDYILCSQRWRSSIQSEKKRPGADCGSDHELLIAKFRLKLKKVGKTTRPFRHGLNQIPYDYTVEVRNRFKGLDLIDRVPDELWKEVRDIV